MDCGAIDLCRKKFGVEENLEGKNVGSFPPGNGQRSVEILGKHLS